MAAIDCIFGTWNQWDEFHQWVANSKRPQYCRYFYPTPWHGVDENGEEHVGRITNTPMKVDKWLWEHCPIEFVRERIKEVYKEEVLAEWEKEKNHDS